MRRHMAPVATHFPTPMWEGLEARAIGSVTNLDALRASSLYLRLKLTFTLRPPDVRAGQADVSLVVAAG